MAKVLRWTNRAGAAGAIGLTSAGSAATLRPMFVFDQPVTIAPSDQTPVAKAERLVVMPARDVPPISFHDLQIVPGGTSYLPTDVRVGEHPPPWNAPVTHADRQVGGEMFGFRG